jgi:hypothetical protein
MTATKTRKPETRIARLMTLGTSQVLALTAGKNTTFYRLESLESDFGQAFRLSKADNGNGEPEVYDVNLMAGGRSTCECLGFLHHGHKTTCKHVAALFQLQKRGLLPVAAVKPQPASEPVELDDL